MCRSPSVVYLSVSGSNLKPSMASPKSHSLCLVYRPVF